MERYYYTAWPASTVIISYEAHFYFYLHMRKKKWIMLLSHSIYFYLHYSKHMDPEYMYYVCMRCLYA